jgi:hypothetical protein
VVAWEEIGEFSGMRYRKTGGKVMTESLKEAAQQALRGLPDEELGQVLDFLSYLHWKREEKTDWL